MAVFIERLIAWWSTWVFLPAAFISQVNVLRTPAVSLAASKGPFLSSPLARHMYPESRFSDAQGMPEQPGTAGPIPQFIEIQSNSSSLRAASLCRINCIYLDAVRRPDGTLAFLPPTHKSDNLHLWCLCDSGAQFPHLHFSVAALLSPMHAIGSLLEQCGKPRREICINICDLRRSRHASEFLI